MTDQTTTDPYEMQKNLPTSPDALLARLKALGIESHTVDHKPVFTVEESRELRGQLPGGHVKNLFLRNKKEEMWLVTVEESKRVDLKSLGEKLTGATGGAAKLSFGSPDRLMTYLGVIPGAVTVFGLINDTEGKVKVVLDQELMSHDVINGHPLTNEATTSIAAADLIRFVEATGHDPVILKVS